ncbi:permease-like cell division protein FtsX [Candidatus Margulisiibacteriota bacterium]
MAINTEFFLKEAWLSMKRGGLMTFTALLIIFISLIMFGIFLLIVFNLNSLVGSMSDKMEIMAYVDKNFTKAGVENMQLKIKQVPGVENISFVSKEAAWESFRKNFKNIDLGNVLESNPLPDAYKIKTKTLELIPYVSKALQEIPGIEDVRYGGEMADRIRVFSNVVRWIGLGIIIAMTLTTLLIVVNTIRLTVLARKDDVYIMRLVGATNSFIRWPFILEGILLGVCGAFFASLCLKITYDLLAQKLQQTLPFLPISFNMLEINLIYLFIFGLGIFLGFLGASISAAQSLKLTQT